jgi:hypothetical protein
MCGEPAKAKFRKIVKQTLQLLGKKLKNQLMTEPPRTLIMVHNDSIEERLFSYTNIG